MDNNFNSVWNGIILCENTDLHTVTYINYKSTIDWHGTFLQPASLNSLSPFWHDSNLCSHLKEDQNRNWKEVTINNSQEKNCCYEIMGVYHSHCFVCCFQFYCRSLRLNTCIHPLLHSWVVTEAFPYDKFNSAI